MPLRVNDEAVKNAEYLIGEGDYRINTIWREAQPSESAARRFYEQHGPEEFARWYLAVDTDERDVTARYKFPIGDFKSVHRSGLVAARDLAQRQNIEDVQEAADELIFFFDRVSAC